MGFVAKYDSGTCPKCREPIEGGEEIQLYSGGRFNRYEHVVCPNPDLPTWIVLCTVHGDAWIKCRCAGETLVTGPRE